MTVTITLTVSGSNTGPFDLHSDLDAYAVPFESAVARNDLIAGYTTALVPDGTNTIRIISTGECTNYIDVTVIPYTTTTSTSTSTSTSTTTTTTTVTPVCESFDITIDQTDIDNADDGTIYADTDYFTLCPGTGSVISWTVAGSYSICIIEDGTIILYMTEGGNKVLPAVSTASSTGMSCPTTTTTTTAP